MSRKQPTEWEPQFTPATKHASWFLEWQPYVSKTRWTCSVCGKRRLKTDCAWSFRGGPMVCTPCHNTLSIERAIIEEGPAEGESAG